MTTAVTVGEPTRNFALRRLPTAGGRFLSRLRLRYRVLGDTEAAAENGWILVFHALTESADVDGWWGPLVGPGKALDTTRHAIVAANLLGSCYGSSGPTEWRAETGETFPELSPADLARAHIPLLEHLGVRRLALATGGSLGGMVALEWGRLTSVPTDRLVVFADSDILYLPGEVRDWVSAYRAGGVRAEYREIASLYGHDAFLIEWDQVERIFAGV